MDLLVASQCAPDVRSGIVWDLPGAVSRSPSNALAAQLRAALVLPLTWKSAIARAGQHPGAGGLCCEARFGLINRGCWGEKALSRYARYPRNPRGCDCAAHLSRDQGKATMTGAEAAVLPGSSSKSSRSAKRAALRRAKVLRATIAIALFNAGEKSFGSVIGPSP
jgi:hypothetical protein